MVREPPEGMMMTSATDDLVPQRPSRPTDSETFYWHPQLGYIRADHARHLYDDSASEDEQRHLSAMHLDPAREGDCCGDCSDEGEERDDAGEMAKAEEEPDQGEEPASDAKMMAHIAEEVELVASRVIGVLDELAALRQLVKELLQQNEVLVAALRAHGRVEDLTNEDIPSEDLTSDEEDLTSDEDLGAPAADLPLLN
jgi:hypothetical protein